MKCTVITPDSVYDVMHKAGKRPLEIIEKINTLINKYIPIVYTHEIPGIIHHKLFIKIIHDKGLLREFYIELVQALK